MGAPCETCPPHCAQCAWDQKQEGQPKGLLTVIRSANQYSCVKSAAVVVDAAHQPFMQLGGKFHPLTAFGANLLAGTRLAGDIAMASA